MSEVLRDVRRLFEGGTLAAESDGELLERFVSRRDEAAFEALVSRHGPMVLRVSRDLLRDDHAAEDVFQATFLLLARKGRSLWVNGSLSGWLYGVARRVAAKSRTSLERRRRLEGDAASFGSSREAEATLLSPDEARILHEEIARLPASHRLPILLCGLRGMSYAEAAGQLGLTESAIRGRLARGRERLRARLIRRGVGTPVGFLAGTLVADRALGALNADLVIRRAVEVVMALESRHESRAARRLATWAASLFQGGVFGKALTCGLLLAVGFALGGGGRRESAGRWLVATGGMKERASAVAAPTPAPTDEILRPPSPQLVADPSGKSDSTPPKGVPKPWETTVRVKVYPPERNEIGFGSGTIIRSNPQESLVLVVAHIFEFHVDAKRVGLPASNPRKVRVDLFDGKLTSKQAVTPVETLVADIVDFDRERDICLLRIHPGRQLPASPLLPRDWSPEAGAMMITGGCSLGQDATFWSTRVKDPNATLSISQRSFEGIACEFAPAPGRSGGGLFDAEGRLAGFCQYAEPRGNLGYYANLRLIYELLDRNPEDPSPPNTARRIEQSSPSNEPTASSETSRQSFEKDYERLIQHAERQRQAGDDRGLQESLDALDRRYRTERKALIERIAELDSLHSRSIEPLRSSLGKRGLIRLLPFGPRSGGKQEGSTPPAPDVEPSLELDNASGEGAP